jgi:hypothetical protein
LLAATLILAACGDSVLDPSAPTSSTNGTTSTSGPVETSAATTTIAATTSTTTLLLTTSTTVTTTTPTTLPPIPLEFLADGLNIVDFGERPAATVTAVRDYLGTIKTFDSGWGPAWGDYGACPGTEYRQVEFGGLVLQFSDGGNFQPAGTRHFFAWSYDGTPPGITTPGGLDVGMTVADLQALYPSVMLAYDDLYYGDVFRVEGASPGEQLWGMLTGPGSSDTITYLTGGWGCGE